MYSWIVCGVLSNWLGTYIHVATQKETNCRPLSVPIINGGI